MGNLALLQSMVKVNETWLDYFIIGVYFVFVLGIGAVLRTKMQTSEDYFLSGRSLPSWITGLAFLGANLGALEIMGMGAGAATYGIMQAHYYWIGAIPAMVFVALFMIPFYYASRVHSVPGFLRLRYNEATRGFNSVLFAIFMILLSGINMFAMALVFQLLLGWSLTASILLSAAIVLAYVALGGLSSSIYNEVLQFFLITLGLVPLVIFGLIDVGGLSGLKESIGDPQFFHVWANTGSTDNPFEVQWFYIVFGLGLVQSFGYWCTDFLVVQRALAAEDLAASQRTPLIAAFPKLLYGVLAIFPGLIALSILGPKIATAAEANNAVPYAMAYYFPTGMLGFGLTALLAAFMSGMAGNIDGLQYRLYLRHLQTVHQPGRPRPPLSQCGPHRHCCWCAPEHRNCLPCSRLHYHHELRPGAAWNVPGPIVRDVPPGHVLEAHDGLGWVHRTRCWNGLRPHHVPHLAGRRPGGVHGAERFSRGS